jgi:hypothetical protein
VRTSSRHISNAWRADCHLTAEGDRSAGSDDVNCAWLIVVIRTRRGYVGERGRGSGCGECRRWQSVRWIPCTLSKWAKRTVSEGLWGSKCEKSLGKRVRRKMGLTCVKYAPQSSET